MTPWSGPSAAGRATSWSCSGAVQYWEARSAELVEALLEELGGTRGAFSRVVEELTRVDPRRNGQAVSSWSIVQQDDLTCVVARYDPDRG